jgi:hypothetical protein
MLNRPKGSVGSSDAHIIAKGDPVKLERCRQLFMEEIKWPEPTWFMQLGTCTEALHLDWLMKNDLAVCVLQSTQETARNDSRPRNHATTDAIIFDPGSKFADHSDYYAIETKHVHTGWNWHGLISEYYGQIQHIMDMTETDALIFSAIFGNAEPAYMLIDRDNKFIANLRLNIDAFLAQCDSGKPYPLDEGLVTPLRANPKHKGLLLEVDMYGNNEWGEAAGKLIATKAAIADHEAAKATLKEMSKHTLKAHGSGVTVSTTKTGTQRVTIDK